LSRLRITCSQRAARRVSHASLTLRRTRRPQPILGAIHGAFRSQLPGPRAQWSKQSAGSRASYDPSASGDASLRCASVLSLDREGATLLTHCGTRRLTHSAGRNAEPAWSPDGHKIAFRSTRNDGNREIYVMNADGSNQRNLTRTQQRTVVLPGRRKGGGSRSSATATGVSSLTS
jgi:dipeptidyl aminopeptidase/acylaminoacyl peptidase